MDYKEFMQFMRKVMSNKSLFEELSKSNIAFVRYTNLFYKLDRGSVKEKPNLIKAAEKAVIKTGQASELDYITLSNKSIAEDCYTIKISTMIDAPANRLLKEKYIGAYYLINMWIIVEKGSFGDILLKMLLNEYADEILYTLCKNKGLILDKKIIENLRPHNNNLFTKTIETVGINYYIMEWTIEDDLTLDEILNKETDLMEKWKRLYLETKYCLGE